MSVDACWFTRNTGRKCRTASGRIGWLYEGFEFRVAAVCWNSSCRADPEAARLRAPPTPEPAFTLTREERDEVLSFILRQCPVLYIPFCQQETLDSKVETPLVQLGDIARPSVEPNWFAEEKVTIFNIPEAAQADVSNALETWLGSTDDAESRSPHTV